MNSKTALKQNVLNQWLKQGIQVNSAEQSITVNGQQIKVEPLVMELLEMLISQCNQVVHKDLIMNTLWQGKYVNDEALTKLVSKLRKALHDDPKQPKFIKTIPKKGYLLICETPPEKPQSFLPLWLAAVVIFVLLLVMLLTIYTSPNANTEQIVQDSNIAVMYDRAESHYYQYSRLENESAIKLYEKIIAQDSNHALSQSGLANALVQKTLRWPNDIDSSKVNHINLSQTIESGRLNSKPAQQQLKRAEGLAERAVEQAPENAKAHRSLGLVYAAQQKFDLAEQQYLKAIELDPNEWGAMINLAEIQTIRGQAEKSLTTLQQAYQAMTISYQTEEVFIRPWYTKLAVLIAEKNLEFDQLSEAEVWFRKALDYDPYHQAALTGLMQILQDLGDFDAADALCFELQQKIDPNANCFSK